jgi:3-deoxy-7-phosphoheptulonate synthase
MNIKKPQLDDVNIASFTALVTPDELKKTIPLTTQSLAVVKESRKLVADILAGHDKRTLVIMGPCSIHDPKSALEYAARLKELAHEVSDTMVLIMRAYFEKPRTTVGWKGFINDPYLDNSFRINDGLHLARRLLLDITNLGLGVATEALEPVSPQYIAELISWTAIGARTAESQTHRELSSGLSSPVGFKNNTDGNIEVAINAMKSAREPHHFLGIDQLGRTSIVATKGNPHCHLILRGGKESPNYDAQAVAYAQKLLREARLCEKLVIDCSHDNSHKDYLRQSEVFLNCINQIVEGNDQIVGLMLESHLEGGQQKLSSTLDYGVSITDGCLGFDLSQKLIRAAVQQLKKRAIKATKR